MALIFPITSLELRLLEETPANDNMILATAHELSQHLKPNARLMGLDVGEKTIGLALSDVLRTIASPLETIDRKTFTKDMERMAQIIQTHNIGGLVIGYPINMNGTEGPRCQSIRQFARNVAEKHPVPLVLWDERMSTMAVERTMIEAGMTRQKRDLVVDKLAASYILQSFLDTQKT